jgi:serine/threonine protein kinase
MSATFPTNLGRLQQVRHIGAGAFASVWLYYDPDLDSHVAVKALSPGWVSNPEIHKRFLQEARLLRSVDSPHVVRVYDIGQTSTGIPFFVMSYADGGSVADLLKRSPGGLDVHEVADIVAQAADGLMALKARGVIHRDIKPANLLLTSETSGGTAGARRVMIADLGVARSLDSLNEVTRDIGTPSYMAPEQLDPSLPIDHRADVRALGAVAWALLAGRSPAPALGLTSRVPEAGSVRPLPAPISQAIARALEPRAEDRWPDARSFADGLRGAVKGTRVAPGPQPHSAPQPPPTSPWQKSAAPPSGPPSGPPTGSPFEQPTTVPTSIATQQPPKRKRTGLLVGGLAAVVVVGLVAGLIFFVTNGGSQVPEAGECRNLDYAAATEFVDETEPVDCAEPHTLYTFHVATDVKTYNDNEAAGAACFTRLETGLGLHPETLARTAYIVSWYWPSESTWNDGDRYVRCDVGVTVQKAPMIDLPEDPVPDPFPADLRACIDSEIDKVVRCGTTHDHIVVDTFEMTGDTYPEQSETNIQGLGGCPSEATMFKAPFRTAWMAGSRLGLCAKYDVES